MSAEKDEALTFALQKRAEFTDAIKSFRGFDAASNIPAPHPNEVSQGDKIGALQTLEQETLSLLEHLSNYVASLQHYETVLSKPKGT
jgi:hypothetical protein